MWEESEMGLQRKTRWDLNPSAAAIEREDHVVLGEKTEDHAALGCSFLPRGLGSKRDFARKKRGERTLAGGP